MKKNKGLREENHEYNCVECGFKTRTLHEILYGSANKQFSIDHYFQAPLCGIDNPAGSCHDKVHRFLLKEEREKKQEKWAMALYGLDYWEVNRRFNKYHENVSWFEAMKKANKEILLSMVI